MTGRGAPAAARTDADVERLLAEEMHGRLAPAFVTRVVETERAHDSGLSAVELLARSRSVLLAWIRRGAYPLSTFPTLPTSPLTTTSHDQRGTDMTHRQTGTGATTALSQEECWSLLEQNVVGRVGFDIGHGNRIYPVNYALEGRSILVRTDPDSELGRCVELFGDGTVLAFEADHIDNERHRGWSVLVQGSGGRVSAAEEESLRAQGSPHPWAGGAKPLLLRIVPVQVTGRRVGRDW